MLAGGGVGVGCLGAGLGFLGLTPQQQPGSFQGGEMMMKSVFWWRKPEYPEKITDLRQITEGLGGVGWGGGVAAKEEFHSTLYKIFHVA